MSELPAAWLRDGQRPRIRHVDIAGANAIVPTLAHAVARSVVPTVAHAVGRAVVFAIGIVVAAMIIAAPTAFAATIGMIVALLLSW